VHHEDFPFPQQMVLWYMQSRIHTLVEISTLPNPTQSYYITSGYYMTLPLPFELPQELGSPSQSSGTRGNAGLFDQLNSEPLTQIQCLLAAYGFPGGLVVADTPPTLCPHL
jgi:hypothetical protein